MGGELSTIVILEDNTVIIHSKQIPERISQLQDDIGYATITLVNNQLLEYAKKSEIPKALPNQYALNFMGAVNATYDGTEEVNVLIPNGGGGAEWQELADYTTTEDLATIEYTNLKCKDFVMLVKGRVNDATASLANGNSSSYTYVNGVSHGGAATAFFIRASGAAFPVIYHVEVLGGVIEQSVSRKAMGANMGNLQVSERIVETNEINSIRVVFATSGHLLKSGATIRVFVR
jgi:hypothetical protein